MRTYYSNEPINDEILLRYDHGIFLAGPTPRSREVKSWRPEALNILNNLQYKGIVWVPEYSIKPINFDYMSQVEWEKWGLESCTKIVFWIPRVLPDMPAFTTNVEFGRYIDSGRIIYGRPDNAEKCKYLDWMYMDVIGYEPFNNLNQLLEKAIT